MTPLQKYLKMREKSISSGLNKGYEELNRIIINSITNKIKNVLNIIYVYNCQIIMSQKIIKKLF